MTRLTINTAIDRCHEQIEASTDPETTSAWQQVLEGIEVVIDYDTRLEAIEDRLDELWAYHTCEGRPEWRCDVHD